MGYVKRTVVCGCVVEVKKMKSARSGGRSGERGPLKGKTGEKQARANERRAEEVLRWKLNANFRAHDYHVVLHYADKTRGFFECRKDLSRFLRRLREICRKFNVPYRYIAATETKRMTNIHHHVVMNRIPLWMVEQAWEEVTMSLGAGISLRPLDRRGNHKELAAYLIKESRSTMERYQEEGLRGKRFTCSQGLITPEPQYERVEAARWTSEPKARQGAYLWKNKDGNTVENGVDEDTGTPWQLYFEVYDERRDGKTLEEAGNEAVMRPKTHERWWKGKK